MHLKNNFVCIILVISLLNCSTKNKNDYSLLASLGLIESLGNYWAKIYKFNPNIVNDPTNIAYIDVATPQIVDNSKTKIILISGWNYNDRSNRSYPTIDELKNRALNKNWGHFVPTTQFALLISNYEVYTFDYLTSDPIDTNGYRLRVLMDDLFHKYNNNVIIFAHSMGGLVSRFALYYSERPAYIKAIITAGTPFHGSPWASPQYQKNKTVLGSLANFLTDSEGGRDLAWDNYDFSLNGAFNIKLYNINQQRDRDDLIYALYGEIPGGNTYASDSNRNFLTFCSVLNDFASHDCIVPSRSAILDGNPIRDRKKIGNYDHSDINWHTNFVRNYLLTYINNL